MTDLSQQFPDTVIRASAGTGKTFQLSNRYLGLLHQNQPPEQILASTFARKAAGEILERVMMRLAEAAESENEQRELEDHLKSGPLTQERAAILLSQLVQHLHQLRVGTLDAFFVQTASHFALEFGLPGGWTILEDLDDRALRIEALRQMLREKSKSWDELTTLIGLLQKGESARDVVDSLLTTIDDFYALFQETEAPAWTGQPKLPTLSEEQVAQQILALQEAPLPENGHHKNAHKASIQYAQQELWDNFLSAGFPKCILADNLVFYRKEIEPLFVELYEPLVTHARGEVVNKLLYQTEATYRLLESFHACYHPLKLKRRGLRFEDISRTLAENLPRTELQHIEFRLDASLHHLLLDEFQDTSLLQWKVIQLFAKEVNRQNEKTFFCVGDVKQAIYGWRGGISEIFDKVASELDQIQELPLDESRRSAPVIMEVVNEVFGSLSTNPALGEDPDVQRTWQTRFQTHKTFHEDYTGFVQLETYPVDEDGKTDKWRKARFVAEKVASLHREHPGCTIGVLTRTNQTVGRIIHYLRNPVAGTREPVFASEEGGNPLTDSAAVIYILSLMKLAAHPGDLVARFNVVHSPLAEIVNYKNHRSDATARAVASQVRQQLLQEGYGPTIENWIRQLAPRCDRRELDRLLQLVELAWQYEERATLNPLDFVHYVEETKVESPSSADVRVMTVHQSKGLQFDLVVLPELDGTIVSGRDKYIVDRAEPTAPVTRVTRYFSSRLLPLMPEEIQIMFEQHRSRTINEALCLLYVAITRAVHSLYVITEPNQKPESLRASTILTNALSEEDPEPATVLREIGDPDWYERHRAKFESRTVEREPEPAEELTSIPLAPAGSRRSRNLDMIQPSAHETGIAPMSELLQPSRSLERARGSLIHAWLEQINWLDEHRPTEDELRKVAGQFSRPGLDLEETLNWFQQRLEIPALRAELDSRQYRAEVAPSLFPDLAEELANDEIDLVVQRERRIVYRTDREIVNGIVDRMVLYQRDGQVIAADVIDYKTDFADDEASIERLKELYRPQLEKYDQAMQTLYQLEEERVVLRLGLTSVCEFRRL
ncbi:MAG: UvrD-helicase domain-containing protein [Planctomycetaceae bacterium]|nr:UvrD-helicase domain-containing protein [Planctomycetaceae bacterium]